MVVHVEKVNILYFLYYVSSWGNTLFMKTIKTKFIYAPTFLKSNQGDFAPVFVKAGIHQPAKHINNLLV